MINILGFIIALCTVTLQAEESRHNCSNYYLIIEETIFGHDLISLDAINLNLLDPAIPRHCYLDLSCDSYIDSCPPRIVPTRYSTHIDVPDAPTITKGYPELTHTETAVTEVPRVSTTIKDTDETTPSATSTVHDKITVTETPRVSTSTVTTTIRGADETTSSVTPIVHDKVTVSETTRVSATTSDTTETTPSVTPTVHDKATVTETPRVSTSTVTTSIRGTDETTPTVSPRVSKVTVTEILRVSTTIRDIDETTPSVTSSLRDEVTVTETPRISTTIRDIDETTPTVTSTIRDKVTVTETPRISTTIRDIDETTPTVTSTIRDKVTVTETPRISTTIKNTVETTSSGTRTVHDKVTVTETPIASTTIRGTDGTTSTVTPTVIKVAVTKTLKPTNTATDAPKLNFTSNTENTFNNEHLTRKNGTNNCSECLSSMLRNNAVSIIMVLVLLAIGVFACNTLCYVFVKGMGRCMNRSPVLCASNTYDVSKYE